MPWLLWGGRELRQAALSLAPLTNSAVEMNMFIILKNTVGAEMCARTHESAARPQLDARPRLLTNAGTHGCRNTKNEPTV